MTKERFASYIKSFDFTELFIELGWNNYDSSNPITVDEETFEIQGIVEKRGFVIVLCPPTRDGIIPLSKTRKKIEHAFGKIHKEHLIIYEDVEKTKQIWQFVVEEPDKPRKTREIQYVKEQDPEILYQRARGLLFTLDEEENITLVDVIGRFKEHFAQNTEQVTKKFYTEFKKQHNDFLNFISGIDDVPAVQENKNKQWYASLMLNRLMFCYFIQKRGYLDNNVHYLRDKLKEVKTKEGSNKFYNFYRDFLLVLFHKGLGKPQKQRDVSVDLGTIPYLNGGLFDVHELERQFEEIDIRDEAFERIFDFFDQWNWHLDTSEGSSGKDINPDVIGYIFEKYINDRAAMGAYYTKEDITDYIGKNTIIPFLFDTVKRAYANAFKQNGSVWTFLRESGDTYIYDAVKKGIPKKQGLFDDLPREILAGFVPDLEKQIVHDSTSPHLWEIRKCWNKKAPEGIALPTETYRELIERRKRYAEVKEKIESGHITEITDFITYNLNIRQFTQDLLENIDDSDFIRHFYKALTSIAILDPTCGSGAFLFAALNILEPFYETCIERMEQFTAEEPRKYKFFHEVLANVNSEEHPNLSYFIYKTIILNNLYGVDIMHEAVEIAKLRLFLKMVGAVDINVRKPNFGLEPLPDVDFNIRAGNTLVGFATEEDFKKAVYDKEGFFADEIITQYEDEFTITAKAFQRFQDSQLIIDKGEETHKKAKADLRQRLADLNEKLNRYCASLYGIDANNIPNKKTLQQKYREWLESHRPFHWVAEFYDIITDRGGFDVVIGNPPYVEYSKVGYKIKNYKTEECRNLYAFVMEKIMILAKSNGYNSMIVPLSGHSTQRMSSLTNEYYNSFSFCHIINLSGDAHPSTLFDGVRFRLSIFICHSNRDINTKSTRYIRWYAKERENLFISLLNFGKIENACENIIPKIISPFYENIFYKIKTNNSGTLLRDIGNYSMRYHNTPIHWIRAHSFVPYFISERDGEKISNQLKELHYESDIKSRASTSIFCSSLFFIFWIANSDCYHLNKSEINKFPYNWNRKTSNTLAEIELSLENDLKIKAIRRVYYYKTSGRVEYDEYYMKKSKPIIDQIDTVLAQHYGFTEEELDFIINYDIKYRMGDELEAYVNGTLGRKNSEGT